MGPRGGNLQGNHHEYNITNVTLPDGHRIAQTFQGLDGPLPLSCLLLRVTVIIPRLLITAPHSEEVIDDHENCVGDGERNLSSPRAAFDEQLTRSTTSFGGMWPVTTYRPCAGGASSPPHSSPEEDCS